MITNTTHFNPKRLLKILSLLMVLGSAFSFAQIQQTFNSSGTFIVPAGVTSITVGAWGAGGAGGGSTNAGFFDGARGGAGGGGGAYAQNTITVTPGQILSIVVGTGAVGTIGANGGNGGFSTIMGFETMIKASGGEGGEGNTRGGNSTGGAGGSLVASSGTIKTAGANGGSGDTGWGVSSGAGGAGANGGGLGGASWGILQTEDGNSGKLPGGGGGGARTSFDVGSRTGGAGGAGRIILSYTCSSPGSVSLSSGVGSNYQTKCINTPLTNITYNTTGATSIMVTGLPAGITGSRSSDGKTYTISGSPTEAGTFNYTLTVTGNCGTVNATGTITVNPNVSAGTVSYTSNSICIGTTATYSSNGTPGGVWSSSDNLIATVSSTGVVTGVSAGSAIITYTLTSGCGTPKTASEDITVGPTTIFNGTDWTNGVPSNLTTTMVVASGTYITSGNLSACNCTVNPGAALTIASNSSLTLENYLRNNGGTVTVESDGNLVQINNSAANIGNITVKRNARMKRLDYTYWGSPVSGQNLKAFSPGTVNNRFYTYNEFNDFFEIIDPLTNVFGNNRLGAFESDAKGYTIRANNAYPAWTDPATAMYTTFEGIFKGTPHNGNITFPLQKLGGGHNLVGNPYASNIDFHALAAAGTIEGVAYFWTNASPTPATQEGSSYAGTNYSVYTVLSGGTPAVNGGPETKPERFIKVGQGFIVQAKAAGTLTFNNAMRDNGTGGASTFINKTAATKSEAIDRFWLKLTTPAKNFNTILVAYPKGATNGFESNADAKQLTGSSDEFYSVQNDMKLIIQGRQFPLQNTDKVALGMKNYQAGTYTLSLSEKEGVFANGQAVYLTDSQTGIVTNLSESNYTFTAAAGVADNRFELSYEPQVKVLATDTATKEKVEVYKDGKTFVIRSAGKKITGLEVYDATGKLMISSAPQQTEARVEAGSWPKGSYILKITRNGEVTTRKVLN